MNARIKKLFGSILPVVILALSLMLVPARPVQAAACVVTSGAGSGEGTLSALLLDDTCDTITFAGDFTISFPVEGRMFVNHSVTVDGTGHNIVITGGMIWLMEENVSVVMNHITLDYAMIFNQGLLTISDSTVKGYIPSSDSNMASPIMNSNQLVVTGSTFTGNNGNMGGAIMSTGPLTVTGCTFTGNRSQGGGAIVNSGPMTITDSDFIDNQAEAGGAIMNFGVSTITGSDFIDNRASQFAGAIMNGRSLTVTDSRFSGNSVIDATDPKDDGTGTEDSLLGGGAIFSLTEYASLTVENSTFDHNTAPEFGAAIYHGVYQHGRLLVKNSTFSDNSTSRQALSWPSGAVLSASDGTFINNTFSGNTTASTSGTYEMVPASAITAKELTLYNNIFIGNGTVPSCFASTINGSNNLANDASCLPAGATPSDSILLGTLGDYGGPTQTLPLLLGSAAIDAGDSANCPAVDQRGVARPQDGNLDGTPTCDIGAFEYTKTVPAANPGGPYVGAINTAIPFDGSASSDLDGDPLTYAWDFGGGEPASGAQPTHIYTTTGIYDVCLTVNDGLNIVGPVCTMVVVFDPSAGYVTGGGVMDSPAGAYLADPNLSGKASFGFLSKYQKGANVPSGHTEFVFQAGDLNFRSDSYEWMLVNQSGANAQFKGTGTINGDLDPNGNAYKFMLWAGDGSSTNSPDTFCIKIWSEDAGGLENSVYDNGVDQAIRSGNILVHTGR